MKYKHHIFLPAFTCLVVGCNPKALGTKDKFVYPDYEQDAINKKVLVTSEGHYIVDYRLKNDFDFNNNKYYARVRIYNSANIDTFYYRDTEMGLVYVDTKSFKETIEMPANPKVGDKWRENSNWVYEVKSINATLKTPLKEFTNLVEIECTQTTGETKNKFRKYNNFFAEGIGKVGSVVDGTLITYIDLEKSKLK